jgi:hypothetical protein
VRHGTCLKLPEPDEHQGSILDPSKRKGILALRTGRESRVEARPFFQLADSALEVTELTESTRP